MKTALGYLDFDTWISFYNSVDDLRDKVILGILYSTGSTEKELVSLKCSDIDLRRKLISFRSRKSSISPELGNLIRTYLLQQKIKKGYIFRTRQSNTLSEKRIQQIIAELSLAHLKHKIVPKTIRYSHIAHALLRNVSVFSICEQTGLKAQRVLQIAAKMKIKVSYRYNLWQM